MPRQGTTKNKSVTAKGKRIGSKGHKLNVCYSLKSVEFVNFVGDFSRTKSSSIFPFREKSKVSRPRTQLVYLSQDAVCDVCQKESRKIVDGVSNVPKLRKLFICKSHLHFVALYTCRQRQKFRRWCGLQEFCHEWYVPGVASPALKVCRISLGN